MDKQVLDAIYDHLKPVQYIGGSIIFREGEPLDEMLFITSGGILRTYRTTATGIETDQTYLSYFYGEELISWVWDFPNLSNPPLSTKTVIADTQVELFVLRANELKNVVTKFWWLFLKQQRLRGFSLFNMDKWKPMAVYALQVAWRRHYKRIKLVKSAETDINHKHDFSTLTIVDATSVNNSRSYRSSNARTQIHPALNPAS